MPVTLAKLASVTGEVVTNNAIGEDLFADYVIPSRGTDVPASIRGGQNDISCKF
jgi:hypothetical protein